MNGSLRRFWTMWHRCLPGDTIEASIQSELKHSTDAMGKQQRFPSRWTVKKILIVEDHPIFRWGLSERIKEKLKWIIFSA